MRRATIGQTVSIALTLYAVNLYIILCVLLYTHNTVNTVNRDLKLSDRMQSGYFRLSISR